MKVSEAYIGQIVVDVVHMNSDFPAFNVGHITRLTQNSYGETIAVVHWDKKLPSFLQEFDSEYESSIHFGLLEPLTGKLYERVLEGRLAQEI